MDTATLPDEESLLAPTDLPTPESSARWLNPPGIDHVLGDGRAWRLPHYIPNRDRVWDELHDQGTLFGRFEWGDMLLAVVKLLLTNYDVPPDFAAWLVVRADRTVINNAVNWALYGKPDQLRGYSEWVESSLLINGIDPDTVPPRLVREVLDQLVATGRAVPVDQFTTAGLTAAKRARMTQVNQQIEQSNQEAAQLRSTPVGRSAPQTFAGPTS